MESPFLLERIPKFVPQSIDFDCRKKYSQSVWRGKDFKRS